MRRSGSCFLGLLCMLITVGCVSAPSGSGAPAVPRDAALEERVRELLDEWQATVRDQDIDRYMRLYWDDAIKLNGEPHGVMHILEGVGQIREEMQVVFAEHGEFLSEHEYPPAEYSFDELTGMAQLKFGLENPSLIEALRFDEREGVLKIAEHWVFHRFFPEPAASEFTGWVDEQGNGNGRLEPDEQERLFIATYQVMFEPGPVDTPLDDFFDWNENRQLDEYECEIAATEILRNRLRRIDRWNEEFARHRVPPTGEQYVSIHNTNWIIGAVLDTEFFIPVGPAGMIPERESELVDMNRDGMISQIEVDIYLDLLMRVGSVNPAPTTYNSWMPAFTDDIQRWINVGVESEFADDEYSDAGYTLFGIAAFPSGVLTWTPVHRFFDRNRDGILGEVEREWARDFIFTFLFPAAVEMGVEVYDWEENARVEFGFDFDGDPRISVGEQDSVRGFVIDFDEQFWQKNDPNGTPHRWVDYNDDGEIEMWEADIFRDKLFQALMRAWMQIPYEEANSLAVRSALDQAADVNGDGMLSVAEREFLINGLMQPHEVGSEFDREIDFDGNGQLTMDEIYRAQDAGVIPVGEESAERRVAALGFGGGAAGGAANAVEPIAEGDEAVESDGPDARGTSMIRRNRTATPARVKAVSSWGSSLAVLGVRDMTEKMQAAQTDLLVSFLENAFVNYGNVTVVDRQNLEKIMEEYKYQTSALVDEDTAVEIGKLSGANAIAIGNLSKLGETFYLHLKIINVESGAIIGSSISQGLSENDFLGMCNGAVDPLF